MERSQVLYAMSQLTRYWMITAYDAIIATSVACLALAKMSTSLPSKISP
ncbi:hypothetical protein SAMN05421764_1103 [Donghicola eburneus]|uniref:Putative ATPase n=1 Tax=Donghicola eburneus TaxID=393278 RepID=A0A1M4MZF1_9RHOB|nr:putative ATPase [Donghicola eburneus]SFQ68756.1 hypothetical protein SAMN05421764_1103 [Donghicola eburneus]